MNNIIQWCNAVNLDPLIILLVIAAGYFQEKYMCGITWSTDHRYDAALKTLGMSFIATLVYILLVFASDRTIKVPMVKYFISYFAATSLYDMIIRPFRKWLAKTTGDDAPTTPAA